MLFVLMCTADAPLLRINNSTAALLCSVKTSQHAA